MKDQGRPGLDYPCPTCQLIGLASPLCHESKEQSTQRTAETVNRQHAADIERGQLIRREMVEHEDNLRVEARRHRREMDKIEKVYDLRMGTE
jgi:hypothetical protein